MSKYLEYGKFKFCEATTDEERNSIYRLRYEVYALEFGFENPYDFPDKLEQDQYDPYSVHFIALNEYNETIGTVRMILNSKKGFPVEHASEITNFDDKPAPEMITEISRLAVSKMLRRRPEDGMHGVESYIPGDQGGVLDKPNKKNASFIEKRQKPAIILGLYRAVYQKCKRLGITHMYMITEDKLFHALYKFGFIFKKVGEPVEYHGKRTPFATSWHVIEEHMDKKHRDLLTFLRFNLEQKYYHKID